MQNVFRQEKKLADKFLGDRVFVELFVGGGGIVWLKENQRYFVTTVTVTTVTTFCMANTKQYMSSG